MGRDQDRPHRPHHHDENCTDDPTPDPGQTDRQWPIDDVVTPAPGQMGGTTTDPGSDDRVLVPAASEDPEFFSTGVIIGVAAGALVLLVIGLLLLALLVYTRRKSKSGDAEKPSGFTNQSGPADCYDGSITPPVRNNTYVNTVGTANRESTGTHVYEDPDAAAPPPYDYPEDYDPGVYEEPGAHPGPQYQCLKDSSYVNTGAYTQLDPVTQLAQVFRGTTPMVANPAYKPKGHKTGGSVLRPSANIPRTGVEYMVTNLRPTLGGVETREATPAAGSGTQSADGEGSEGYMDMGGSTVSARTARYLELLENSQGGYSGSSSSQSSGYVRPS